MEPIILEIDARGIAHLTINKAEVHNAFDDTLISDFTEKLKKIELNESVRVVVLSALGESFSAGGDLNWMRRVANYSQEENVIDAMSLAELMRTLNQLSKPTIALVQGSAYGGGVGLVSCCDIVIASENSKFCLSEVKLGLIASVISPYVVSSIGESQARRYTLTGEPFDSEEAKRIGLVHEVVKSDQLLIMGDRILSQLLKNGPKAMAGVKNLIFYLKGRGLEDEVIEETARRIAQVRASDEGKEGVSAFLEKRPPSWVKF